MNGKFIMFAGGTFCLAMTAASILAGIGKSGNLEYGQAVLWSLFGIIWVMTWCGQDGDGV